MADPTRKRLRFPALIPAGPFHTKFEALAESARITNSPVVPAGPTRRKSGAPGRREWQTQICKFSCEKRETDGDTRFTCRKETWRPAAARFIASTRWRLQDFPASLTGKRSWFYSKVTCICDRTRACFGTGLLSNRPLNLTFLLLCTVD